MKDNLLFAVASRVFKMLTILAMFCLLLSYLSPFVHPKTIPFLPFFGLSYPIFILIAILLFFVCLFARSRWALFILFFILIGGNLHFRQFPIGYSRTISSESEGLKVMSFNVRLFGLYDWSTDLSNKNRIRIFEFLEERSPDIVCFQEFYQQDKTTNFPTRDSLIKRLQTIDFHERYSYKSKGRQHFGIAMLSKFPMIAKGEVPLQLEVGEKSDNYCIFADIVKNKDTIRVYNVHLQSIKLEKNDYEIFDKEGRASQNQTSIIENTIFKMRTAYPRRADQSKLVVEHAKASPYPVVICGDFNDTPMSYAYNQFYKSFVDAFREASFGIGSTYAGKIPAGRIDYIFHGNQLKASDFKIQEEVVSDHRAIWCTIAKNNIK